MRLPKEFRFNGTEVLLQRVGDAAVMLPKSASWKTLIESLDKFPAEFMNEREQPTQEDQRETLT